METLIAHPENNQQIQALKIFLDNYKIRYETKIQTVDFSDIAGKLSWRGDALAAQKKIRGEWYFLNLSEKLQALAA